MKTYRTSSDSIRTPSDFVRAAEMFGARNANVYHEKPANAVVEVQGLDASDRYHLCQYLRKNGPAGTTVDVREWGKSNDAGTKYTDTYDGHTITITQDDRMFVDGYDITDEYRGRQIAEDTIYEVKHRIGAGELPPDREILTDAELLTVISALPDDWESGEDVELSEVDWDRLKPLAKKYGGLDNLITVASQSVSKPPHERSSQDDPTYSSTNESDSASSQRRTEETDELDELKRQYVESEITLLEFESRLEDVIEVEPFP